jgi:hypothetical protein
VTVRHQTIPCLKHGAMPSTVCAHAMLREPSNPGLFGTAEIVSDAGLLPPPTSRRWSHA